MLSATRYSCALVTGASAGLGEEFAFQLAPRVDKLVLVARREARLTHLADSIRERFPRVAVSVLVVDLTKPSERARLVESLAANGFSPDLVVNNAGMGDYGEFSSSEWSKAETMIRLNIEALTYLCHALLPHMIRRGGGGIINVSSLASLVPIPDFAVYAATKAYVTSFSEALRIEMKPHRVSVLALCPGPVHTEFGSVARRNTESVIPGREWFYVPKEQVVSAALSALEQNRPRVYPGWKIAASALVLGALPLAALRLALGTRPRRR
jgi:short-subunit dehydrogenase